MTTTLDDIEVRIEAAAVRTAETFRYLPATRLLSRAEHDRQRLVKDARTMAATLREIEALHPMRAAVPGLHGDICGTCTTPWPCPTATPITKMVPRSLDGTIPTTRDTTESEH